MKRHQQETVARLKILYSKQGEDRIFARMHVALPVQMQDSIDHKTSQISLGEFPTVDQLFPLWEEYLAFHDTIEDDWVAAIYPRQYDQGFYGAVFGAPMELNRVGAPGAVSSMTRAFEDETYEELLQRISNPNEEWITRLESDLRYLSGRSRGRWGVAVVITIDGLNFCMQIRGNQTMLDLHDCPSSVQALLQAAVGVNIKFVERQRAAIDMAYEGGVYDFFNAGWVPGRTVPMSVDCYNLCSPDIYAEFGLAYQQQLIDHFGGGNFHIHGNGRHLLPELAKLKGCVVAHIGDDGSKVKAIDDLERIKRQAGSITPVVSCGKQEFVRKLGERSLLGGIYYMVGELQSIPEANRLMESVRSYRL